jgi:hypothetical protein
VAGGGGCPAFVCFCGGLGAANFVRNLATLESWLGCLVWMGRARELLDISRPAIWRVSEPTVAMLARLEVETRTRDRVDLVLFAISL